VEKVVVEAVIPRGLRLPDWSLELKKRSVASAHVTASARSIQPRSTPTGYVESANPTTAMLEGAPGRVVSAINPLTGFALRRKYSNAVRCTRSRRASSLSWRAPGVVSAFCRIASHEAADVELADRVK